MRKESLYSKMGLQFFAEPGEGGAGSEGAGGQQGNNAGTEGGAAGSQAGGQAGGTPKTFTQEEVNNMMANEKRTARSALLKELGYEVKDGDYKKTISTVKGILDAGKTQQQLDQEARTKAEEDKTAAETKANQLQAQVDVMKAGVKPDYVDDAITMLLPKVTEEKPLTKLLEEYKTKYPSWFGEAEGSKGTGGPTNPPRGKGGEAGGMGKRLAQTGKSKAQAKSSYFKN